MDNKKTYNLLLVAGDYEIIQQVSRALGSARFYVQNAFNHREAQYMLTHGEFDVVLVDAAMIDRHTGAATLPMTTSAVSDVPVIAFALDHNAQAVVEQVGVPAINITEIAVIRRTLSRVLGISVYHQTGLLPPQADDPILSGQYERFNTLFALSKSLTEVLDLSEVLNRVVDAARQLSGADEAMILLPEGDELYLRARVGIGLDVAQNFRVKTRDTLAGQVFFTGRPVMIGKDGPHKVKTEYFVNALLYVPIMIRNETIGVLGVNNHSKGEEFTDNHRQFLEALASFAAVAIQNARTHTESLARNRDLETLVSATQALNAPLSLEEALSNVALQMARTLRVEHIQIFEWNRLDDRLYLQAWHDDSVWPFGRGPLVDMEELGAIRAMIANEGRQRGYCWVTPDVPNDEQTRRWLPEIGADTVLIVPVYAEHLLGVLRLFFVQAPHEPFDGELMDDIRQRALRVVADLLNNSERPLTLAIRKLIDHIRQRSGADWCDVLLPVRGDSALGVALRIGEAAWTGRPQPSIDLSAYHDLRDSLQAGQPVEARQSTRQNTAGGAHLLARTDSRSILAVPMVDKTRTRGLVVFGCTAQERHFIGRDVMMARAIVSQGAIALENARLVHDLESSLGELQVTQERLVQTARLSAMGELASVVAHQMNNPLTTIIADTELMLLDEPEDSPRREALLAIARTGKRASSVARRLLAIARPSEESSDYIDAVDSLHGVLALLSGYLKQAGIKLDVTVPDEKLPPVRAVRGRLDDIWLNLLMNAYEAVRDAPKPCVIVDVAHDDARRELYVSVADNGAGIPDDLHDKIFLPFFTTKSGGESTGLGLHISRRTAESADGSIRLECADGWTRFVVTLPTHTTIVVD
ncbi:MAG: GAF domain-containing protein [Anaerolineaceae bacterium]|nr:MAG: GAF domain-containing protein [Anaerolineaceae bacterium]